MIFRESEHPMSNVTRNSAQRGNSRAYILSRLQRDKPGLAQAVVSGELTAAQAKRLAYGNRFSFQAKARDLSDLVLQLVERLSAKDLDKLIRELKAYQDIEEMLND
jgi:hypothetical protein